ncbi:hypothetical protein D3C81_1898310 [compost metagenome]
MCGFGNQAQAGLRGVVIAVQAQLVEAVLKLMQRKFVLRRRYAGRLRQMRVEH